MIFLKYCVCNYERQYICFLDRMIQNMNYWVHQKCITDGQLEAGISVPDKWLKGECNEIDLK